MAYADIVKTSKNHDIVLRDAAFVNAILKSMDVMEQRSIFL